MDREPFKTKLSISVLQSWTRYEGRAQDGGRLDVLLWEDRACADGYLDVRRSADRQAYWSDPPKVPKARIIPKTQTPSLSLVKISRLVRRTTERLIDDTEAELNAGQNGTSGALAGNTDSLIGTSLPSTIVS